MTLTAYRFSIGELAVLAKVEKFNFRINIVLLVDRRA